MILSGLFCFVAAKHDEKSQKKLGISKKKIPKDISFFML